MREAKQSEAKPRVAWFSLLPVGATNADSLSANFSANTLPWLREHFEIELFHNSFETYQDYPTYHYLTAIERQRERPFDLVFYQLEDSKACGFIRIHLGLMPGLVLFYNFILSDDGPEPILNSAWQETVEKFHGKRSEWPDRLAEHKKESRYALREAGLALVALFSSEKDHADFKRLAKKRLAGPSEQLSFYLPFPIAPFPNRGACSASRVAEPLTLLFCGKPRIEYRAHKVLEALRALGSKVKLRWLIDASEEAQCLRLLNEFEIGNVELLSGRSPERWSQLVEQGGVAVHLLFSVFGQVFPYLQISMSAGLPCFVSDFGGSEYLPENSVYRISPGESEATQLTLALERILREPSLRENLCARSFALENHLAQNVAHEMVLAFKRAQPIFSELRGRWEKFEAAAQVALREEALSLVGPDAEQQGFIAQVFRDLKW